MCENLCFLKFTVAGDFSICAYPDTDCNNDETNNQLVIVEEPAFEIDGSWYSDEEDDKPNVSIYFAIFKIFHFCYPLSVLPM